MRKFGPFSARRQRRAVISAALIALAGALLGCGHDEPTQTTNAALGSGKLKWDHFPVTLKADALLYDQGAAEADFYAAKSFWETRARKKLFDLGTWPASQLPFSGPASNPTDLLDNALTFIKPWPLRPQIAGNTTVHSNGNTIEKAVIFLNPDTALCDGDCTDPGDSLRTSRRRLLAHELGHFLGFAHIQDKDNIMYPEIQPGGSLEDRTIDQGLLDRLTSP